MIAIFFNILVYRERKQAGHNLRINCFAKIRLAINVLKKHGMVFPKKVVRLICHRSSFRWKKENTIKVIPDMLVNIF